MSDYFHEQMMQKMLKEPCKIELHLENRQQIWERDEYGMYKSPISIVEQQTKEIAEECAKQFDEAVMVSVQRTLGVEVDKEELVKALNYDRNQYNIGFLDGKMARWNPIKTRPLEEDEADIYPGFDFMYDCKLPDDGQEVLVTLANGEVTTDTFYRDELDECYFENYCNEGDVKAWMPKPEPYKENEK